MPSTITSSPSANAQSTSITIARGLDTYGTLNQILSRNMPYRIGICATKGSRSSMEDTHGFVVNFDAVRGQGLFAIFDGHGNQLAAEWCGAEFHKHILNAIRSQPTAPIVDVLATAFKTMDKSLLELSNVSEPMALSGSTAVTAFLRIEDANRQQPFISTPPTNGRLAGTSYPSCKASIVPPAHCRRVLYCANVGDSRAVLSRGGQPMRLTYDHKTTDASEIKRLEKEGGAIVKGRVGGYINVTRSLGDHASEEDGFSLKQFIISVPYTTRTELTDEDEFLILACDGLWDVMSDLEAVQEIRNIKDAEAASLKLQKLAISSGTRDNVTVIVVRFEPSDVA